MQIEKSIKTKKPKLRKYLLISSKDFEFSASLDKVPNALKAFALEIYINII